MWAELSSGRPGIVVIEGPRGIGKSALLSAVLARLPVPSHVLRARCTAAESEFAYGVVEQLFGRAGTNERAGGDSTHGVLHGYLQLARSMSESTPVVVAIDDLQHADDESLQWLSFITRRLDDRPLAVVVCVESGTPGALLAERIASDESMGGFGIVLRPGPLCETCTESVASGLFDSPLDTELAVACHVLSQGNPLVLREFVNRLRVAGVSAGSPDVGTVLTIAAATLADTSLEWLRERNPAAADLLVAIALLGPDSDGSTAGMLVGQGELEVSESLRALVSAGLLQPGEPARVSGPLVSAAALSRIAAAEREELHVNAAQLMNRLGNSSRRAADHLLLVSPGGRERVVAILRSAGREAAKEGHNDAAARYLRRAAAETDTESGALAMEIGTLALHHDLPMALRCIDAAMADLPTVEERAAGLGPLVNPVLLAEGPAALSTFLDAARDVLASRERARPEDLGLGALAVLAGQLRSLPTWLRSVPSAGDRPTRAAGDDAAERALLGAFAALAAAGGRRRRRAMRLARRAADGAMDLGAAVVGAVVAACWAEEFEDATRWADWMVDATRARTHRAELALALIVRATIALRCGEVQPALDDAREAAELARSVRSAGLASLAATTAAAALVEQDQLDRAAETLAAAPPPVDAHLLIRAAALRIRGIVALRAGEHRAALRLLQECGYTLAARGVTNPACLPWRAEVVLCHLALGEHDEAHRVAADDLFLAQLWGSPGAHGRALLSRSRCHSGPEAVALGEQAVAMLGDTRLRLDFRSACTHLAECHVQAGDMEAADDVLARVTSGTAGCGADSAGMRSAGALARPAAAPADGARLTFSEGRVTDLVVQGLTNQEVADALCISRRTVDTHLNRVYRKLGINSRGELAEVLSHRD